MIRLVFVPVEQLLVMNEPEIVHDKQLVTLDKYCTKSDVNRQNSKMSSIRKVLDKESPVKDNITKWCSSYAHMYSKTAKVLVSIPNHSGLADRIVGIVSSYLFAILSDRVFKIGKRKGLRSIGDAFVPSNDCPLDWTRPIDPPWVIETLRDKATVRQYNTSVLKSGYYAVNTIDDQELQNKFIKENIEPLLGSSDTNTTFICINR